MFGQAKSFPHHLSQHLRVLYLVIMLSNRHGNIHNIYFLKGIPPQQVGIYLSCKSHHWNRIHKGGSQASYQIGSPWAGGGNTHPHLACSSGVAICPMSRILLMSGKNLIDILCIIKGIVKRKYHASRIAKKSIYTLLPQDFHNYLSSIHIWLLLY